MATMQTVVDLARVPLNDDNDGVDVGRRYPDATLLRFAIHGLLDFFRERSDVFIGQMTAPPTLTMTLGSTFPIADEYIMPLADWVTYRAEMSDDENVDGQRAMSFSQFYGRSA